MSDTPAGTSTPAGPTGPGALPGALDGHAERSADVPYNTPQQPTPPADAAATEAAPTNGEVPNGQLSPYAPIPQQAQYGVGQQVNPYHGPVYAGAQHAGTPYGGAPYGAPQYGGGQYGGQYGVGAYPAVGYGQPQDLSQGQPQGQTPPGAPPNTPPTGPPTAVLPADQAPKPKGGRRLASMVAVAVLAAAVGGGVGGYVGHESSSSSAVGTLSQPVPASGDLPVSPITQVAQKVLPSVVQLEGNAGEGSGVILSAEGLILTNAHVLAAAQGGQLTATFQNGTTAPVQQVGEDTQADIAVVRAQGVSGLTPIQLGNSDSLQVGQQVVAIGTPLGLAGTVTSGIVSSLNRPVETQGEPSPSQSQGGLGGLGSLGGLGGLVQQAPAPTSVLDAIQTDAAINPGNSGGPLVDMQGRIVGLNSAIASLGSGRGGQSGSIGLGFSIPINQAKRIADELIASGHATQAQLGVSVQDSQPNGAKLVNVAPDSAAAKSGLQPGDVVTKVGDRLIENSDALVAAINSAVPGSNVTLTVASGAGAPRQVPVTLGSVTAS
ncbi:MAG TPA: trypsin-like peptidase domain-containing protein [Pseudonocardia sp.]|jgi:putative serine protease PepD|nr:trypsin-like peptidase domain-containing protein [Pseudonocardia sp.]